MSAQLLEEINSLFLAPEATFAVAPVSAARAALLLPRRRPLEAA